MASLKNLFVNRKWRVAVIATVAVSVFALVCNEVPEYCGEGNRLNPATQFCFNNKTYDKCGNAEYDPTSQICEGNILKSKCGDEFFNSASQFCKNEKVYSKCGGNGGMEYDPVTQVCDAGAVKNKCGNDYYDSASAFCLNNTVYQKCRGAAYEPANQTCENGVVKGKCGNKYYNAETEFCYMNSEVYEKCNGKTYDPVADGECKEISMVFVQGGTFTMGCTPEPGYDCFADEKPTHKVTLGSFYIGRYEITQKQWVDVMGNNPSEIKGDDLPIIGVPWDSVQIFIRKLNTKTGKNYRLPTEAEWEYAARGGIKSEGYAYAGSNNINDVTWWYYTSHGDLQVIGTKQPNELGIYDMSGNASEWCHDGKRTYNTGSQTNPMGSTTGWGVVRGGSYFDTDRYCCRLSYRGHNGYYHGRVGFRLAHSP